MQPRGKNSVSPKPDPRPHEPTRFAVPLGPLTPTHTSSVTRSLTSAATRHLRPPASGDDYLTMLRVVGMTCGVLIQVSGHGTDNSLLLRMLEQNPERLRGVALVPPDSTDEMLDRYRNAGVVGVRMNTLGNGGIGIEYLDRYERICAELGWHIQFIANPESLKAMGSRLGNLEVPYVIDHMGHFDVNAGTGDAGWRLVLALVADGAWTKLSGAYRISTAPRYEDTIPFARQLVQTAPDRLVWGSDWPHVGDLLDVLADWVPTKRTGTRFSSVTLTTYTASTPAAASPAITNRGDEAHPVRQRPGTSLRGAPIFASSRPSLVSDIQIDD